MEYSVFEVSGDFVRRVTNRAEPRRSLLTAQFGDEAVFIRGTDPSARLCFCDFKRQKGSKTSSSLLLDARVMFVLMQRRRGHTFKWGFLQVEERKQREDLR